MAKDYSGIENITVKEIYDFVDDYKQMLRGNKEVPKEIEFKFSESLSAIDELFYSYLLLFKQDFPHTKIILDIPKNEITNKAFQLAKQHIVFLNAYHKAPFISVKGEPHLNLRNVKSDEFIPHILVKESSWDDEKNRLSMFIDNDESETWDKIKEISIESRNSLLSKQTFSQKEEFTKKIKELFPVNLNSDLAWFYSIDLLSDLWVLRRIVFECFEGKYLRTNKYRIPWLTQEISDTLIDKTSTTLISNGFYKFSPIKIFIFSLLVKNSSLFNIQQATKSFNGRYDSYIDEYQIHLKHLLKQTNDICYGLEELAKNILEHAGKKGKKGFGVISVRLHSHSKVRTFKNGGTVFSKWYNLYAGKKFSFLDINVIDSGLEGIPTKYKKNLQNEIIKYSQKEYEPYSILKKELELDVKRINDEKYTFSRFLNYERIELLHQIHRANARLGLLIFSDLVVEKKGGIIKIASTDLKCEDSDHAYIFKDKNEFKVDNSLYVGSFIHLGTNYNFIIPIERVHNKIIFSDDYKSLGTSTSSLKALFKYEIIDHEKLPRTNPSKKTYLIDNIPVPDEVDKYEKIYALSKAIKDDHEKQNNCIILLNAQSFSSILTNSSDWVRLLACIQISNNIPVIVVNIALSIHQEIITINRIYDSINQFWNNDSHTLFYIKCKYTYEHRNTINGKHQELSLWFCDVLTGKTFDNYLAINQSISSYHYNLYSIVDHKFDHGNNYTSPRQSKLFSWDGKLLNFELLINLKDGLALFEESVESLLNLEINTLPDKNLLKDNVDKDEAFYYKIKGYKVSNSHFKLGSKIHISDFYYAKRIFYNSFFANRFAFLAADFIFNNLISLEPRNEEITLIGYSRYSELLVSNTRRLLEELGFNKINHDIILEDNRVLKHASKINEKVIIIIPISSTFSTSDKIKKRLDIILKKHGRNEHQSIKNTDINILLVADKNFENFDRTNNLYREFRWEKWKDSENKINDFTTKTLEKGEVNEGEISYQKYFIAVTTDWQAIHQCRFCFPDGIKKEKERCLLETGTNSVSPESIFGFPISRPKAKNKDITFENYLGENNKPIVLHKHIKKNNIHFKLYIRAGAFLFKNKGKIRDWLKVLAKEKITSEENIVIITPSKSANSGFANLVNEYLFSETATVLQYSSTDDILQNFISFNSGFFYNSKILFVDDVLHSAHSFHLINDYIKSIPVQNRNPKCIDHCICIFNRLGYFEEKNVLNSLSVIEERQGKIFSFLELDIPPIVQPNYEFPDVAKGNLFTELANSSVTDMMKLHFLELAENIRAYDIDNNSIEPKSELIHLFNFLVYKALFSFFHGEFKYNSEFAYSDDRIELFAQDDKSKILEILLKFVREDLYVSDFLNSELGSKYKHEVETRIIYICSTPPFAYYKDIKESAFSWVEMKLSDILSDFVKNESNTEFFIDFHKCKAYDSDVKAEIPVAFSNYQRFKLFLRLAVELKSNHVFSIETLKAIRILLAMLGKECFRYSYTKDFIKGEKGADQAVLFRIHNETGFSLVEKKDKEISPIGFITYYTGLIQQLIYKEEAKATMVIKNIVEIVEDSKAEASNDIEYLSLRNNFDNHFTNLQRNLILENTFIFDTFHNTFYDETQELHQYTLQKEVDKSQFHSFKTNLIDYKGQASRFSALNKMLLRYKLENGELEERRDVFLEEAFQKTIFLKTLLRNELENKHIDGNIQQKVSTILSYLCDILDISRKKCNGGAFFTIRYRNLNQNAYEISEDDLYTIDNFSTSDDERIKSDLTSSTSIIYELYRGIKEEGSKKPDSTVELLYDDDENKYKSIPLEKSWNDEKIDVNSGYSETSHDQKYNNLFFLKISDINEDISHFSIIEMLVDILNNDGFNRDTFERELSNVNKELSRIIWEKIDEIIKKDGKEKEELSREDISGIKEILLERKNRIAFKTNPLAMLCFYKCNLKMKKKCISCTQEFCSSNGENKRFDPKRIRFLLILREDIRKFIYYHLTNDGLRAFVEESKKVKDLNSPDHNYYNNLVDLNNCIPEKVKEGSKYKFIYSMLFDKKKLNKILETGNIVNEDNQKINVKQQIEYYCANIVTHIETKDIDIDIAPNCTIQFPEFIFRAIICEYLINANKGLKSIIPKIIKVNPSLKINGSINKKVLSLTIKNNSVLDYDSLSAYSVELKEKGYIKRTSIKGLYLNALLLKSIGSNTPSIKLNKPNRNGVYIFKVNLKIATYE